MKQIIKEGNALFEAESNDRKVRDIVENLLDEIKNGGDTAGRSFSEKFDKWSPCTLDISAALKKGENTIKIKVTNLWVNRLIGDAQPETKEKITFKTMPFYQKDATLIPAGLSGPSKLVSKK